MTNPLSDELNAAFHQHKSVNRVLRHLKRQEVGLYNCICSVIADTGFVKEIAGLYPDLPVVANLRCGLWYAPPAAATCYFKSTDGHYGNWSFSCTRLNLHTAFLAAREGGCLIVDATRRGKTFPDAFTKTVPIWAAVLNRAVAAVRSEQHAAWDTELHLPPWISGNEASQIRSHLDGWVQQLLQVGADVVGLAATLARPLRPLWVSQASCIWLDSVAAPSELPFTPLILMSASLPNARLRRLARGEEGGEGGWSYEYVPGAGDDEESWARGLTPELLWQHQQELVSAGPDGVHAVVRSLLREDSAAAANGGAGRALSTGGERPPVAISEAGPAPLHRLPPLGARSGSAAGAVRCTGRGLFWIGDTRVALGGAAAGAAPEAWEHVDAVLSCCSTAPPSMAGEKGTRAQLRRPLAPAQAEHPRDAIIDLYELAGPLGRFLHLPVQDAKHARRGLQARLPAALQFASAHLSRGGRVLIHCSDGLDVCVCIMVALLLACFSPTSAPGVQPTFLGEFTATTSAAVQPAPAPVQPAASGTDFAACGPPSEAALMCPPACQKAACTACNGDAGAAAACSSTSSSCWVSGAGAEHASCTGSGGPRLLDVSKADVRQRLAYVSACYPDARPTRASLKQVFAFFQQHRACLQPG